MTRRMTPYLRSVPARSASLALAAMVLCTTGAGPAQARIGFGTQGLRTFRYQWFNPAQVRDAARHQGALNLMLGGKNYVVEVVPNDMRNPDLLVVANGATPISPPPATTYKGHVRGVEGSIVRLDIRHDRIEGYVRMADQWWFIEPVVDPMTMTAYPSHLVYQAKDLAPVQAACGVGTEHLLGRLSEALENPAPPAAAATSLRRLEIATDSDYPYYLGHGASSAADVQSILNQVEGIYEAQLGVTFDIVFQNVWTSADPYSSTDPGTLLNQFRTYWRDSLPGVSRDLAHLFTGRNLDGNVIGIAWIGTVCSSNYGYGLSQDFTGYTGYLVALTAHEVGHNFDASHDTGLPPTIMYPSITDTSIFSSFSIAEIASYVSGLPESCLNTVSGGTPTTTSSTTTTTTTTTSTTTTSLPRIDSCPASDPQIAQPVIEANRKCQERLGQAAVAAFSTTLRAMEKCLRKASAGKIPGDPSTACRGTLGTDYTPPTESETQRAVLSAAERLRRSIAQACTDAQIAQLDSCGTDVASAASCLIDTVRTLAYGLSLDTYGQAYFGPVAKSVVKCQRAVHNAAYGFAGAVLRSKIKCLDRVNRGKLSGNPLTLCLERHGTSGQSLAPTDSSVATAQAKQIERLAKQVAKSCAAPDIASLDTCSTAGTLADLQTCLLCAHSGAVLELIGETY